MTAGLSVEATAPAFRSICERHIDRPCAADRTATGLAHPPSAGAVDHVRDRGRPVQ